jgi:hypothetical protein
MRCSVVGLTLISLVACSSVFAEEGQLSTGPDGAKKVQKLPSPNQGRLPKNNKQLSSRQSRSAPPSLPLSSVESYAAQHSADLPVSSPEKPASSAPNSWTGFYVGAGIGAARE